MSRSDIEHYQLQSLLKSGGEGSVYLAEDRRLGRRVAVKLRPLPADPGLRNAAVEEARQWAALNDPTIVQLYDVVVRPGRLGLVMEYVDGHDLEELLAVAEPDIPSSLLLAQDICTALAAAHAHGIVHGDLKPANVLVSRQGRIQLTDFGVAFRDGGGSASALSPEQVRGEALTPASDLFALGCLLYRLLTGRHPFLVPGDHRLPGSAVCEVTPAGFARLGVRVHPALESLVFELLEKEPFRRPGSALQVRQRLLAISRDHPAGSRAALGELATQPPSESTSPVTEDSATGDIPARLWHPARVGVGLVLLVLVLGVFSEFTGRHPVQVVLEPVRLDGPSRLSTGELQALLEDTVGTHSRLRLAAVAEEHLVIEVSCNQHICVTQLVRRGTGPERSDTRSLLPSADEVAWRRRLEQGLRELFAP